MGNAVPIIPMLFPERISFVKVRRAPTRSFDETTCYILPTRLPLAWQYDHFRIGIRNVTVIFLKINWVSLGLRLVSCMRIQWRGLLTPSKTDHTYWLASSQRLGPHFAKDCGRRISKCILCYISYHNTSFTPKFCTCHDSTAVVTYTKFQWDNMQRIIDTGQCILVGLKLRYHNT